MKRICLFAGFDANNIVQDYVIYYIKKMSEVADVYYFGECDMPETELKKIAPYVKNAYAYMHGKYDFGSWQELVNKIGWKEIEKYDQMIFANDSCYGPMFPIKNTFNKMDKKNVDFWGITGSFQTIIANSAKKYHVQSYFIVFNNKIIKNQTFRSFIESVSKKDNYADIVNSYEIAMTGILENEGFKSATLAPSIKKDNPTKYPLNLMRRFQSPFVKVKSFIAGNYCLNNPYLLLESCIKNETNYEFLLIEKHLESKGINLQQNQNALIRETFKSSNIIVRNLKWILQIKRTQGNKLLIKVFRIPIFSKKLKSPEKY